MSDLDIRQNAQLPRLCDIKADGVDVLYIAPFPLHEGLVGYLSRVLQIGGVEEPNGRFKVVVPENRQRLPASMSLASQLLHSPRALRKIRNFCRGKAAYIVPSLIGPDEKKVALALDIPLFAPDPMAASIYGTKSGAKRVFASSLINTPPGRHDLSDEASIIGALASLMCSHLDVPRWIFKLDDASGGRGIAHIDVDKLECYHNLMRDHDSDPVAWADANYQAALAARTVNELGRELQHKVVINARWLWRSWRDFTLAFHRAGGVIEASPVHIAASPEVCLTVDPDGVVHITSVHEQIFASPYTCVGTAFPQTAVPYPALREAGLSIGRKCYECGIIGHIGIDFVAFYDDEGQLRVWAVDLNLRLTHTAVMFQFFDFLVGGAFDVTTGRYNVTQNGITSQRSYVMNEMLYHEQLPAMSLQTFFSACRSRGISFDLQERGGTVFNLMDTMSCGALGILTVGVSLVDSVRKFAACLDFIQKHVGPSTEGKPLPGSARVTFKDVIKAIKSLVDAQGR
jgi:hypothetical protein